MKKVKNIDLNTFLNKKRVINKEKYIITETIGYIEEILDGKKYIFEKIRVKANGLIMLNLKSIGKV